MFPDVLLPWQHVCHPTVSLTAQLTVCFRIRYMLYGQKQLVDILFHLRNQASWLPTSFLPDLSATIDTHLCLWNWILGSLVSPRVWSSSLPIRAHFFLQEWELWILPPLKFPSSQWCNWKALGSFSKYNRGNYPRAKQVVGADLAKERRMLS